MWMLSIAISGVRVVRAYTPARGSKSVITTSGRHSWTIDIQCRIVSGSSSRASWRLWRTDAHFWISPSSNAKEGPKISSTRGRRPLRYLNAAPPATTRTSWRSSRASITTSERVAWPIPSPFTP